MALICETVTAGTMRELRDARDRATTADMVELRLDGVVDIDIAGALEGRRRPVIVTCRAAWEGGRFEGPEDERLGLLGQAVEAGAEYVDIEWRSDPARLADLASLAARGTTRLVVSHHGAAGVPDDLATRVRAMRGVAAGGVIKVAMQAMSLADCVRVRDAVGSGTDQVSIAMGAAGLISRVCPWLFDSRWTYGGQAAPGQLPVSQLIDRYRVHATGPGTAIYALTGSPLEHSASPALQNAAFFRAGLNAVYVPMEASDAAEFLAAADAFGVAGASITAPLKTGWAAHGVRIDDAGLQIGAINTLKRADRGWDGRNFDVSGFLAPLKRRRLQMTGQRAVVLGAGGAARAAVWALKHEGARIEVAARRPEAAAQLAADFGVSAVSWPPSSGWDLLVNATPVGTMTEATPLDPEFVRGRVVYDLVYNPPETTLLRIASRAGAEAIGGWEMLASQARAQFEYWTGIGAPDDAMAEAALAFRNTVAESR